MKRLHIQLQPDRSPKLVVPAAVSRLCALDCSSRMSEGEHADRYVNIDFEAADPAALWAAIREQLRADPALAAAAIVVCEGERGWDDYLLLHHFDPANRWMSWRRNDSRTAASAPSR